MYDCLTAELTAFRPQRRQTQERSHANFIAQHYLKETELAIMQNRLPRIERDNEMLIEQNEQLINEFEIVEWYIEVLEGGHNSKELLKNFVLAQAQIKQLEASAVKSKYKFEKKLKFKTNQLKETQE